MFSSLEILLLLHGIQYNLYLYQFNFISYIAIKKLI